MEFFSPLIVAGVFCFALLVLGWFFLSRLRILLAAKPQEGSLLIMQREIEQLRGQLSQALNASAERTQTQLG